MLLAEFNEYSRFLGFSLGSVLGKGKDEHVSEECALCVITCMDLSLVGVMLDEEIWGGGLEGWCRLPVVVVCMEVWWV